MRVGRRADLAPNGARAVGTPRMVGPYTRSCVFVLAILGGSGLQLTAVVEAGPTAQGVAPQGHGRRSIRQWTTEDEMIVSMHQNAYHAISASQSRTRPSEDS